MKDELVADSIALELHRVKLNYGSYSSLDLKRTFSVFILSMVWQTITEMPTTISNLMHAT
jgi:hypothetical protein